MKLTLIYSKKTEVFFVTRHKNLKNVGIVPFIEIVAAMKTAKRNYITMAIIFTSLMLDELENCVKTNLSLCYMFLVYVTVIFKKVILIFKFIFILLHYSVLFQ